MNPYQMIMQNSNANQMSAYSHPMQSAMTSNSPFMGGAVSSMMVMPGMARPGQTFSPGANSFSSLISPATNSNNFLNKATTMTTMNQHSSLPVSTALGQTSNNLAQQNGNLASTAAQNSIASRIGMPGTGSTTTAGTSNPMASQTNMAMGSMVQPNFSKMAAGITAPQNLNSVPQIKVPTMASTVMNFGQGASQPSMMTLNSPIASGGFTPGGNI